MLSELGVTPSDIGAGVILALAILMVFTGRLVPKRYYDEALSRVAEEKAAKDNWRQTAESLLEQNTLLLQHDDVSLHTLRAIRSSVEKGSDDT